MPFDTQTPPAFITVEKLVAGGYGLFRSPAVGLLPWAAPGDQGDIIRTGKVSAEWVRLVTPSPARVTPQCQHFETCGGCQWQMLPLAVQRFWKQRIVAEAFQRIGKLPAPYPIEPVLETAALHYRRKIRYQVSCEKSHHQPLRLELVGYNSATRVSPDPCWLITEVMHQLAEAIQALPWPAVSAPTQLVIRQADGEALHVILEDCWVEPDCLQPWVNILRNKVPGLAGVHVANAGEVSTVWGAETLSMTILEQSFRVSPTSFFQVNTEGAALLVETVQRWAGFGNHLLDAYGGVGVFAANLTRQFNRISLVEAHPEASRDAEANLADYPNARVYGQPVEALLEAGAEALGEPVDVAIVDPPRSGLSKAVCRWLGEHVGQRLIMVSCDAATLARDLGALKTMGWTLMRCQPIDMFPQTHHVEMVCLLERTPTNGGEETC